MPRARRGAARVLAATLGLMLAASCAEIVGADFGDYPYGEPDAAPHALGAGGADAGPGPTGGRSAAGAASSTGGRAQTGGDGGFASGGAPVGSGGAPGGSGSGAGGGGCVGTPVRAEQLQQTITREVTREVTRYSPLDVYIVLDRSGSMNTDTTPTRWEAVVAAVTSFVNSPGSTDMGVGLQYFAAVGPAAPPCSFGDPGCNCVGFCPGFTCVCASDTGGSCNVNDYATPAVPIQLLPAVAPAVVGSLGNARAGGGTPTRPALEGALRYATQWAVNHPDRKTIVVLATDGQPNDCTSTVQNVSDVAATGFASTPSVPTFVLGVGDSVDNLQAIATAGGGQAIIVDDTSGGDPTQRLIGALNTFREAVTDTTTELVTETITESIPVPCEWRIPEPPSGTTFQKDEMNLTFQGGPSGVRQLVGAVQASSDCPNVDHAWYFDSPDSPTKVHVCDQTCTTIQSLTDARVDLVFGCQTEPAVEMR